MGRLNDEMERREHARSFYAFGLSSDLSDSFYELPYDFIIFPDGKMISREEWNDDE